MDFGLLSDILHTLESATAQWTGVLANYGLRLFYLLALIDFSWMAIKYLLAPTTAGAVPQFIWTLISWVLRQGALFGLLTLWPVFLPMIIASFRRAAEAANASSGLSVGAISPSYFIAQGVEIATAMIAEFGMLGLLTHPVSSLLMIGAVFATLAAFLIMAGTLVLTLAESYIAIAAGCLLFGFAGCRWTAGIADGVLSYAFRVGVRIFLTYLIANLCGAVVSLWAHSIDLADAFTAPGATFVLVLTFLVIAILIWHIPRIAANLVPAGNLFKF